MPRKLAMKRTAREDPRCFVCSTRRQSVNRKGSALVEFAVCVLVLTSIVFGSIEVCNTIFLKQALTEAACQGALVAMKPDAQLADVNARIDSVLTPRVISGTVTEVADGNFAGLTAGDTFTIRVTADAGANRFVDIVLTNLSELESIVTLVKQ